MAVFLSAATVILSILYALLMLRFARGWARLQDDLTMPNPSHFPTFSIIVPARNEAVNIRYCLEDIIAQNYPPEKYEIIVTDDFSEDNTPRIVQEIISQYPAHNIRLLKMADEPENEANSFKKAAIKAAICKTSFEWIITTDADCRRGTQWLAGIASCIGIHNPVLISAPVSLGHHNGFFNKAQALEFMGLIGIGASSIAMHAPNMCNGANLIYKKEAFMDVNGFAGNMDLASGDDEFLLQKIHSRWPGKIYFLKNDDTVVYTPPAASLAQFIAQRKRWVSKSRKYTNKNITFILMGAWLFHLCLVLCLVGSFFSSWLLMGFILGFGVKVLAEYYFLHKVSRFFKSSSGLAILLPAAFLYIIYTVFMGIYGNFGNYKWKGRDVN